MTRPVRDFVEHSVFNIDNALVADIVKERYVKLVVFCLMPNHFHLLLKEHAEGGIARYMQRVLNSYTKYHNARHEKSGHVFQGPYRAVHVADNTQLLHTSAYIHRNPRELPQWKDREKSYPWSSYQDIVEDNRWGALLAPDILLEQFNTESYADFLNSSPAKNI